MKTLFYNPIELPAEVHIVSECFGIDITYEPMGDPDHPAWMSELFNLAKCDSFEEVAVRLTKHNEGYTRKSKFAEKEEVNGWISLKEVRTSLSISIFSVVIMSLIVFKESYIFLSTTFSIFSLIALNVSFKK